MARVSTDERRLLLDLGYTSDQVDDMLDYRAARLLENYHAQQKTGFYNEAGEYDGPSPDEAQEGWVERGLTATARDIETNVRATGEAIFTSARQVGLGITEAVGVTSGLLKFLIPAGIILAGYIVFLRYGK